MTITEIKKKIYKQKPVAFLRYIREGVAYYYCKIYDYTQKNNGEQIVEFKIPCTTYEMGNAEFTSEMDAKLLLRWVLQ